MRVRSVTMKPVFRSALTPQSEEITRILAGIKPLPMATTDAGIVIPNSRCQKKRNFAYCSNPECAESRDGVRYEFRFEIEDSLRPCPKCGACRAPMVGILAVTHYLIRDKSGHLEGASGLRYRIACDVENKRHEISTPENHELATGDRGTANCVECLIEADRANVGLYTGSRMLRTS
jgi:hypothetical protein